MISTIINFIASLAIFVGAGVFYIILFSGIGKGQKAVEKFPAAGHWLVKFGLATTTVGAFLNMLTFSNPHSTEIVLNVGMGALFLWAARYHAKKFSVFDPPKRRRWND